MTGDAAGITLVVALTEGPAPAARCAVRVGFSG
jgi:hypothetical protein